jgi:hypothetical protein
VLLKAVVALAAIVVLGYLFVRSADQARAEPYTVPRAHLEGWRLELEPGARPAEPMLVLRAPPELVHGLFRQVFMRAMESMNMFSAAAIPLLLQGEYDGAFAGHVDPDALLSAAHAAGLERATIEPKCMGYKRLSEPGSTRQLYFAIFDAPAVLRFRESLVTRLPAGAAFDPAAQSAVLRVSASGPAFDAWLPMRVTPDADCTAPIVVE